MALTQPAEVADVVRVQLRQSLADVLATATDGRALWLGWQLEKWLRR